jgi:tetratricopeptide (TPR) repeat protein
VLEDHVIDTWLADNRFIIMNRDGEYFDISLVDGSTRSIGKNISGIQRFNNFITYQYKGAKLFANDEFGEYSDEELDFSSYDAQQLVQAGDAKLVVDEYDAAVAEYQKALEIDADNFNAFIGLTAVYKKQNNFEEAHQYIDKALAVADNSNKVQALTLKFEIYKGQSNWSDATDVASQIINLSADNAYQWYIERGYCRFQQGQFNIAIDDFSSALGGTFYGSTKGYVYNIRGVCYSRLNMTPYALNDFKKAGQVGVQDGESESSLAVYFNNLGNTYVKLKKKPEALVAYKKASGYGSQEAARSLRSSFFK